MTPFAFAAAIPSAWRLRMNPRSFCATKDRICRTKSAMKVPIRSLPCRLSSNGIRRKVKLLELEQADMTGLFVPKKGTAL